LKNLYFLQSTEVLETTSVNTANNVEELKETDVEWYFTVSADEDIASQEELLTNKEFNPYADQSANNSQEPC
jgi:hypothetical protein